MVAIEAQESEIRMKQRAESAYTFPRLDVPPPHFEKWVHPEPDADSQRVISFGVAYHKLFEQVAHLESYLSRGHGDAFYPRRSSLLPDIERVSSFLGFEIDVPEVVRDSLAG